MRDGARCMALTLDHQPLSSTNKESELEKDEITDCTSDHENFVAWKWAWKRIMTILARLDVECVKRLVPCIQLCFWCHSSDDVVFSLAASVGSR